MSDVGERSVDGRRYELASNPPAPWSWERYESWLIRAWGDLLRDGDQTNEKLFHRFLEQHPCLIPGGDGGGDSFGGHHGGWGDRLITEPPLPGIFRRFPDFMWLTKNSQDIIPVLIKLEAPSKRWLTKGGNRSAHLTQAEGQLAEWKRMLDEPASRQLFADLYDFPQRWAQEFNLVPRFALIYGRRVEFESMPERSRLRTGFRDMAVDQMTFDRLRPLSGSRGAVCVRMEDLSPRVVAIPPTFRFGPANMESLARMAGVSEAIEANTLISQDRRSFLLERLPYWQELGWASIRGERRGSYGSSDWE